MATHPIELSTRVIDSGVVDERLNRVDGDIWELTDNVAIVESFSHCVTVNTGDGLMCFDASGAQSGTKVVEAIRTWSSAPESMTRVLSSIGCVAMRQNYFGRPSTRSPRMLRITFDVPPMIVYAGA